MSLNGVLTKKVILDSDSTNNRSGFRRRVGSLFGGAIAASRRSRDGKGTTRVRLSESSPQRKCLKEKIVETLLLIHKSESAFCEGGSTCHWRPFGMGYTRPKHNTQVHFQVENALNNNGTFSRKNFRKVIEISWQ